ncbi:MAG: PEP-CTERM sorting domain-containing protein [Verrucomicrobiaceae bacterium]|nr:PEP-CTERM sorting domain-containing protein [Verrucomicrobiaceae bacterium]
MKSYLACFAILFGSFSLSNAAVSVFHIENAGSGQFLDSAGSALTTGGVSIGFFSGPAPSDSAFTTMSGFSDLVAAGYVDVRSAPGATLSGSPFDWDFPLSIGGTVQNIPIGTLPANTQLYVIAFNAGSFVSGNPSTSYAGATQWAVVKDGSNTSPADLGSRSVLLSNAVGAEVLVGLDNGVNVNMAALGAVPEPSRALLGMIGLVALFVRRRR